LTSSFRNEPDGRSKTFKSGQYVNPVFRLKMRTSPSLNADKINTISPGTLLQIIELGPKTTIDGYTSNWVKVKSVNESYFLEGGKFNRTGWVFGAYLEEETVKKVRKEK
ncbi:MAG: SH3 domain-containing protein, partial [Treponema sp.]|nr:SH3 domain-containing protein [Treponema sp.]